VNTPSSPPPAHPRAAARHSASEAQLAAVVRRVGGAIEVLEGDPGLSRVVILEFPDMTHLKAFYGSPDYQELIAIRQRASRGTLLAMEGLALP
jgi:uncharacterized protein (DUF1330 family)